MWMNTAALREESGGESAGKEAGVLRVDDSNDRGSSRDGHPRSHQGHSSQRPLVYLICALLGTSLPTPPLHWPTTSPRAATLSKESE